MNAGGITGSRRRDAAPLTPKSSEWTICSALRRPRGGSTPRATPEMWLYAALLRLFPRAFRERYGAEITEFFSDRWRAARRNGIVAVLRLLMSTVVDLSVHAAA